jgi:hypothetical protein
VAVWSKSLTSPGLKSGFGGRAGTSCAGKDRCHVAGIKQHPSEHGCGKPRGRVIRLIHRHFRVSYFIQIRKSARIKVVTTGCLLCPQLEAAGVCCAYKTPAVPPVPAGVFFLMLPPRPQSSRLAEFGGRGMSFKICRGTLGSLAMFHRDQECVVARQLGSYAPASLIFAKYIYASALRVGVARNAALVL